MTWKFWKREKDIILAEHSTVTVGEILNSLDDEQLMFCYYIANRKWREFLQIVIRIRSKSK